VKPRAATAVAVHGGVVLGGVILGGVVLGVTAVVVARLSGFSLPWLVALTAGLAAGIVVAIGLRGTAPDPGPLAPEVEDRTAGPASTLADLSSLHFAVRTAGSDPDRFEQRIRPRLCGLAVDSLWQRHGLDWRIPADRDAVRAVVGPQTWTLLTAAPHTLRLTPAALSTWLDELETL